MIKKIKKQFHFEYLIEDLEFAVLGINTHTKAYKLCWVLNKLFRWEFKKIEDHTTKEKSFFSRYRYINTEFEYDLMANQSKSGYLITSKKNVNFFLKITSPFCIKNKKDLMKKKSKIPEILLIFDLDLMKKNYIERFISNDTKN